MFENEEWRPIERHPHYSISNYGRIFSQKKNLIRKVSINYKGFPVVTLYADDNKTRYLCHINKLVADAFLPPPQFGDETHVWHIDGDITNCRADNLKWETRSRVQAWNEMHRDRSPKYNTAPVLCHKTGLVYSNAYECGMDVGNVESAIVALCESGNPIYEYVER